MRKGSHGWTDSVVFLLFWHSVNIHSMCWLGKSGDEGVTEDPVRPSPTKQMENGYIVKKRGGEKLWNVSISRSIIMQRFILLSIPTYILLL